MLDQNHYNLPPFRKDFSFPPAADAGRWQSADGTLKQLGQSLKVDEEAFKDPDEPVRAIPDPWAQARTFGEALLATDHSMHKTALSQWRGLLALFALRDLHSGDYTLRPHSVPLGGTHILDKVLKMLTPQIAVGGRTELWQTPWLIMIGRQGYPDVPLAMTNPICLVSPGRLSLKIDLPTIRWAGDAFGDPLKLPEADALPITEIVVLREWLLRLRAALEAFPGEVAGTIRQLLLEYANDCAAEAGVTSLTTEASDSIHQELPALFRPLWGSVRLRPVGDPAAMSHTRLRLNPSYRLGAMKGLVLVDASLGNRPGFSLRHTFVWGTRTLGELLGSENVFRQVQEEAARAGYFLIRADDLFTGRAVRLAKEPLIEGHPPSLQDMLIPLRPLALLLEGTIKDQSSAQSAGSRVSVTYQVRLDDGGETGLVHDVTRHFTADAPAGQPQFVADGDWSIYNASVWPNFKSPAWKSYFARFAYAAGKANIARPYQALSAELIAAELENLQDGYAAVMRLGELNAGRRPLETPQRFMRSEKTIGSEYEDVQFSTSGFDAILYYDAAAGRPEALGGMIFLDLPTRHPSPRETTVAVDFGTTNTVACFDDKQPIVFESRLVQPIVFKNPDTTRNLNHGQRWHFSKFLPAERRPTPTPTVALTRSPNPHQEAIWAFRNIIYFHSRQRHAVNGEAVELKEFSRVAEDAKFNLKWSDQTAHALAAQDFLEQFMTMVAVEAAADNRDPRHLLWRFSVPDSMSAKNQEKFDDNLKRITRGISSEVKDEKSILKPLYSEGLSAARYILQDAGFDPQSLNMVLDIGGGTTDVTIWDVDRLIWKGSFQIAGQNFFTRAISQNPEILRPIGLEHWGALFAENPADDAIARKDIPHLAELLFSGDTLQQAIDTHWDAKLNLDVGKNLRITGLVFLSGIAWYLGTVVKRLAVEGLVATQQLERPAFALCGRGAGIFKKIHGRRATDEESDVTRALQVFGKAAGLDHSPLPQIFTTPDAKLEVVRGMISDNEVLINAAASERKKAMDWCPAGLAVTFGDGAPLGPDMLIGRDAVAGRVNAVDLGQIDAFLEELERTDGIKIDLFPDRAQGTYGQIRNAVRTHFDTAFMKGDPGHRFEPPFITALRALVDELASPSETADKSRSRDKRLSMDFTL